MPLTVDELARIAGVVDDIADVRVAEVLAELERRLVAAGSDGVEVLRAYRDELERPKT